MSITLAFDVTSANYAAVPPGQRCGYWTGSSDIAWTIAMRQANPGAVEIAQSATLAVDVAVFADILDVEGGAAAPPDCGPWAIAMKAAFAANKRPGQRQPAIYFSASNVSNVVNALVAAGITGGVGLWIANWNFSEASAIAAVIAAAGPFPVIGIQYSDLGGGGSYDLDVFSVQWLSKQSGVAGDTVLEGSSGPAVSALQTSLNTWVVPKLVVDGLFGAGTLAAVKSFQTSKHLLVDGVVGPTTWKALEPSQPDPKPVTKATPVPPNRKVSVKSTAAAATFSWSALAGVSGYHLQVEWWKPSFGWVLVEDEVVQATSHTCVAPPQSQFRWRVAANTTDHLWPNWESFTTS